VVGRGLRRASYETEGDSDSERLGEEVAQVFGVPFQVVPFKANQGGVPKPAAKTWRVRALPERAHLEIKFPRVEGFAFEPASEILVDWDSVPSLTVDPTQIPPEVQMKAGLPTNQGRPTLYGPGKLDMATLSAYRSEHRLQTRVAQAARELVKAYKLASDDDAPAPHPTRLYPQFVEIVSKFVQSKVKAPLPAHPADVFLAPYYGWMFERILAGMHPAQGAHERVRLEQHRGPGTTADVEYATRKEPFAVHKSHVNYVVPDSPWERIAAYALDTHASVHSFVKNSGLGFAIPYLHSGTAHDYVPDFIVRMVGPQQRFVIFETKGHDDRLAEKQTAAQRWVDAINFDGRFGVWSYALLRDRAQIAEEINAELDARALAP
jgi:type III restriction enzyme